ncbi:hypothetical protein PC129_g4217 [Phytophthora cactorum]|uniref:Uncharacterized protein n=1 Tax=Phytophthora cactorum TaxID=29920 RepID=A0A8T1IM15_9STRA|nr:hypothetical protein Pcac1_g1574 [Phytophthora cactorum]KAG3197958.1 hypothetical protein PC128_g6404 [Phytophthora cactorum]KAG3225173.1 hypothetical protein PC129_g4217 [Phytophthora cactorum]
MALLHWKRVGGKVWSRKARNNQVFTKTFAAMWAAPPLLLLMKIG